mgnify:CR=1 FL=1
MSSLEGALADLSTVLLFPSETAVPVSTVLSDTVRHLIVIDGTWEQAKGIYFKNKFLHSLKQVKLSHFLHSSLMIAVVYTEYIYC